MDKITASTVSVAMAIIGLATLAVLVSRNANTSGVVSSVASGFSNALSTAISPVTGGSGMSMPRFSAGGGFG